MPAPAASSVSSLRLFTWTPNGWTKMPLTSMFDGSWGIDVRADGPHLVQVHQGQVRDVRTSPEGREAVEAITFVLGTLINAPVVTSAPPPAGAGRPSRSSRRLLVFSPARWQWESAERTSAQPGDVFRLIERSGKVVGIVGKPGPATFRWAGKAGDEVPCEVDDLGLNLSDAELARQGFAWLGVKIDHSASLPDPEPTEATPEPPRARRRVPASPPPPARRALAAVPPDDDRDNDAAPPVSIPDLPPEPPAIDDDPTQEFPNMPANRAQTPSAQDPNADDTTPAEITLREVPSEILAQVRAKFDGGQVRAAIDVWMTVRGWPDGTGREAEDDMLKALGRRKPLAPARRGAGGGVPALHLVTPPKPIIDSPPLDEEERAYLARVHESADAPDDYEAAQEAAARDEVTIPPEPEIDEDQESENEQARTIPVSFPTGSTRASFTRHDETGAAQESFVRDDGTEPDYGTDAYEAPPAHVLLNRPVGIGDVLPRFGTCVSVVTRNESVVLTEDEREHYVVELTEMPSLFAAHEERKRDFMTQWKKDLKRLQARELALGDSIRTFKEVREFQVAGLIKAEWVTEVDANNPDRIFGTRRPNENDQLQTGLFDGRRAADEDDDDDDAGSYEGEDE